MASSPLDKDQKNVPLELTAYGTTPLGKPRLFVCQVCTRAFARLEHLRRHERSHTKEKPFACGVCQRKFSRRDLLLRHAQKLHAGCSDAITRLRRKLIKRGQGDDDDDLSEDEMLNSPLTVADTPMDIDFSDPFRKKMKLPLAVSPLEMPQHTPQVLTPMSRKNSSLLRQIFKGRRRGTSFLAQLGLLYAQGQAQGLSDLYPHLDGVEFSTPQLMPQNDDLGWLSNLSTIPGILSLAETPSDRRTLIALNNLFSLNGDNFSNLGFDGYMMPTLTMGLEIGKVKEEVDFGYLFYDIPDQMMLGKAFDLITKDMTDHYRRLLPIQDETSKRNNIQTPQPFNFDNKLSELDELGQEFDPGLKFLPGGYTFYGDNPLVALLGIEVSPPLVSDINLFGDLWHRPPTDKRLHGYLLNTLFTDRMRNLITKALSKYPISGIMTPSIPLNEKLEMYLQTFKRVFLAHFPFIHLSKLSEAAIMSMTQSEDPNNQLAQACLPLLIATMGALLSNAKADSEHLYEALRRTIHIFLELRKLGEDKKRANPLWLIQLLTLLVIYGLFSDNENNVYIVIRQLNALNLLVKSLIKQGSPLLFAVDDDEDAGLLALDEQRFKHLIVLQLQNRIVFMIYRLTNFLLMMYNVPLTLSINDLVGICLPTREEDAVWRCQLLAEFDTRHPGQLVHFLLAKRLQFKQLLVALLRDRHLVPELESVAKYGFVCLAHGIYEVRQYQEMKNFDVGGVFDRLTQACQSRTPSLGGLDVEKLDFALLQCFIRICSSVEFKMVKEQSWLQNGDELSKNYSLFLGEALGLDGTIGKLDGPDFVTITDNCLAILRLILFRAYDTNGESNGGSTAFSTDFGFLNGNIGNLTEPRALALLELALHIRVLDDFGLLPNSIHSQMLFHVFVLLATYLIFVAKKNQESSGAPEVLFEINHRYQQVLKLLDRIEQGLKQKYPGKYDLEIANLYMYQNGSLNSSMQGGLEKALYILKIGEMVLNYLYDTTLKVLIFRKLSGLLVCIRKFLIDHESRILV